jgi:WD40 repeat protein
MRFNSDKSMATEEEINSLICRTAKSLEDRVLEKTMQEKVISSLVALENSTIVVGFFDGTIRVFKRDFILMNEIECEIGTVAGFLPIADKLLVFGFTNKSALVFADLATKASLSLDMTVQLGDYSADTKILFLAGEKNSFPVLCFKHIDSDPNHLTSDFENLLIEDAVQAGKLMNMYLFIATYEKLTKWNLALKEPELNIDIIGISSIVCTSKNCYFIAETKLKYMQNEGSKELETITNDAENVFGAEDRFLFVVGRNAIKIVDGSKNKPEIIACFSYQHQGPLYASLKMPYLYVANSNVVKRFTCKDELGLQELVRSEYQIVSFSHPSPEYIILATSDCISKYQVEFGDLNFSEQQKVVYYEETVTSLAVDHNNTELAVGNSLNTIKLYSLPDLKEKETIAQLSMPIYCLFYIQNTLVAIASNNSQIQLYIQLTDRIVTINGCFKLFTHSTKAFYFISEANLSCKDSLIKIFDLPSADIKPVNPNPYLISIENSTTFIDSLGIANEIQCNYSEITAMSSNDAYLVMVERRITIRDTSNLALLCSIDYTSIRESSKIKAIGIISEYILVATSNFLHFLSIQNRCFIGAIQANISITKIAANSNNIFFQTNNTIVSCKNMLSESSEPFLIGPAMPSLAFACYFKMKFNETVLPEHVYEWTVLPECISIVHLLAYNSQVALLKSSFRSKANFLRSRTDISPLTIALKKKYSATAEYLVKKIARESSLGQQVYIMSAIENDMPNINKARLTSISLLYREAMKSPSQDDLFNYAQVSFAEKMVLSKELHININDFGLSQTNDGEEAVVTFKASSLRLCFNLGSSSSITFLNSLLLCNDPDVFLTPIIRNYINYKWEKSKPYLMVHSCLYFLFIFLLTLDLLIENEHELFLLIPICILNILDLCYECLQMRFSIIVYFQSKTNWLDLIRIALTFNYVVTNMIWSDKELKDNFDQSRTFSTIILLVTHLRGISYLKMLKQFRYLIKMMEEIFRDSLFFGIILIYMLLALTTFFHFASSADYFFDSFTKIYMMTFGEFHFDQNRRIEWLCFYMISLALPLVMFNLLVAIMGGTYKRAFDGMEEMDLKAMTQLILETEIVMSTFVADDPSKMYIHKCVAGGDDDEDLSDRINVKLKRCIAGISEVSALLSGMENVAMQNVVTEIERAQESKVKMLGEMRDNIVKRKKELAEKIIKARSEKNDKNE